MVAIQNIRNALFGFFISIAVIVIFNKQLEALANLIDATEARIMVKATIIIFFIIIGIVYPTGIGTRDMQQIPQ